MADLVPVTDPAPLVLNNDEDFANAFAEFSKEPTVSIEPTNEQRTDATPAPAIEPSPVPESGTEMDAAARAAADLAAQQTQQTQQTPAPVETKPAPAPLTVDDLAKVLQTVVQPQPVPQQPAPQPAQEYNEDELTAIAAYEKEFPDVYRAEQLIRRSEYKAMLGYTFAQIAPVIRQQNELIASLLNRNHLQAVQEAVPDYGDIRPKVLQWIEEQPDYLKATYQAVARQGNEAQVQDLIQRWRKDTGYVPSADQNQQVAPQVAPQVAQQAAADAKTRKAAAALAPTGAKRSGMMTDAVDPNNFNDAFDKFSQMLSNVK